MSLYVSPLAIGNALSIEFVEPYGTEMVRLLRNQTGVFAGPYDPASTLVYADADVDTAAYDSSGLKNGQTYSYQAYYWLSGAWVPDTVATGIPGVSLIDASVDALSIVLNRLTTGMQNEVASGALVAGKSGVIAVLSAPPIYEETSFPLVTVQQRIEERAVSAIGESIGTDAVDESTGNWSATEGWLANTVLTVTGWTLNPDVRIALRKALRRQVLGNLQVFYSYGLREVEFSQSDADELESYNAPIYQTVGTFKCLAPLIVGDTLPPITEVDVIVNVTENLLSANV